MVDIANINQKGFAERIVTAPFSPPGWPTYVKTKYATAVVLPGTLTNDVRDRSQLKTKSGRPLPGPTNL